MSRSPGGMRRSSSLSSDENDDRALSNPKGRIGQFGSFVHQPVLGADQGNKALRVKPQVIDVYVAAAAFFFAGVLDDAIDLTHRQVRPWAALSILFAHTAGVHLVCAVVCTYIHHFPNLKETHQKRLRAPLAVLTGWMWKSVAEDLSALLVDTASSNEAAQVILWFLYATIITVIAVFFAIATSSIGPGPNDMIFMTILKYILALTSSSLVLPIAGIWNEALTAFVDTAIPEHVGRATTNAVLYGFKALLIHACFATTLQCLVNYRRRSHVAPLPPPTMSNTASQLPSDDKRMRALQSRNAAAWAKHNFMLRRQIFENKILLYVTAWGWWDVPQAVIFSPEFNNRPIYRLLAICVLVLFVMNMALLKTWYAVPRPEELGNYLYIFFALSCHALDPQLGWAIKELYTQSILDFATSYSAQVALFWAGVWLCSIIFFLLIKYLACIDNRSSEDDDNDDPENTIPKLTEGYAQTEETDLESPSVNGRKRRSSKKKARKQEAKQAELGWDDFDLDDDAVSVWTDEFSDIEVSANDAQGSPRLSSSKKVSRKNSLSSKKKSKRNKQSKEEGEDQLESIDNNSNQPGGPSLFCSSALPW